MWHSVDHVRAHLSVSVSLSHNTTLGGIAPRCATPDTVRSSGNPGTSPVGSCTVHAQAGGADVTLTKKMMRRRAEDRRGRRQGMITMIVWKKQLKIRQKMKK